MPSTQDLSKAPRVKRFARNCAKVGEKAICVLDDIPFLLKNTLPKAYESIGSFMLAGAGFIVFPIETAEGVSGFRKAYRKHKKKKNQKFQMGSNLAKVGAGVFGIGVSCSLFIFTATGIGLAAAISSVLVPATVTVISGIELTQKIYKLRQAKLKNDKVEINNAERKVAFGTTYFTFSMGVTALALISTLSGLGVLSLGIIPSAVLIATVVVVLAIKIFEIVDKKHNFKFTNSIKNFFGNSELREEETVRYKKVTQDDPSIQRKNSDFFGKRKHTVQGEDYDPCVNYSYQGS